MTKHIRLTAGAALLAAATALASCAGMGGDTGVSVGRVQQTGYQPSMRNYIADRGGIALEVVGAPFPGAERRFAQIAARTLTESHFGPDFTVHADPADAPDIPFRTVVVVNATETVTPANACKTGPETATQSAADGQLRVIAALCRSDKAVTRVTGRAVGVSGVDDPRVVQLFRQIGLTLYTSRDETVDRDNDLLVMPE